MVIVHYEVNDFQILLYGWSRWNRPHSRLDYQLVVLDFFDNYPNAKGKTGSACAEADGESCTTSSSDTESESEYPPESESDFELY